MKRKYSLINENYFVFEEGDIIIFEMPSFYTGDYKVTVKRDKDFGLYINEDENRFRGCRDFSVIRNGKVV